ncbi:MAG: response regulator transcription factor [Ruminococcaceae bacterium]|nr:response regulator transcription factor [Oscillospiraceae bacterium]
MSSIKIIIVDDMPQVVDYYKMVLEGERDFEIIGFANSGKEAVLKVSKLKPDVVLMDVQMETDDAGIVATKKIKELNPEVKVIMLTAHNDSSNITESFVAGASDFLVNNSSIMEIISTIKDTVRENNQKHDINKAIVDEVVKLKSEKESLIYVLNLISRLSKSEIQILKLICQGKSYRQISVERVVEEVTIRSMVNKMKKKLEVNSLSQITDTLKKNDIFNKLFD